MVHADISTIDQIDAEVTAREGRLRESMPDSTLDERRVQAVLLMATGADEPADVPRPQVVLYLHHYIGPDAEPIARLEGHGPVTEAWIARVLGPKASFKVHQVLDLAGQAPVDAYEIPDRHRQAVHLMTPADVFPYASSLSRDKEVDHTIPHGEGGATGVGNYGPMTVFHHRIKTHGAWQVQQPFPGIYVFRDPHGAFHLVDHTGTRRVRGRKGHSRRKALVVEIYRNAPRIELAA